MAAVSRRRPPTHSSRRAGKYGSHAMDCGCGLWGQRMAAARTRGPRRVARPGGAAATQRTRARAAEQAHMLSAVLPPPASSATLPSGRRRLSAALLASCRIQPQARIGSGTVPLDAEWGIRIAARARLAVRRKQQRARAQNNASCLLPPPPPPTTALNSPGMREATQHLSAQTIRPLPWRPSKQRNALVIHTHTRTYKHNNKRRPTCPPPPAS